MRETRFIEQNKEKWAEYESLIRNPSPDVDKLYSLFYSISDDLAFARTHYPNRQVRVYLNALAMGLFRNVYGGKRSTWKTIRGFWTEDLPLALYHSRPEQTLAFWIFLLAAAIGVVSTLMDPGFPRLILGNDYVEMTLENIAKGHPMAVYNEENPFQMFLKIVSNNLRVCFLGYVTGLMAGIGTLWVLLKNGVMMGVFQSFFHLHGLLIDSFLVIWMHGALEISSLVIGSGAGFTLARGLLFPGTFTRMQSLILAGRRSVIIMTGLVPVITVAGYIESYITRYHEMWWPIKLALILLSLGFILFYFFIYPRKKGPLLADIHLQSTRLTFSRPVPFDTRKVYTSVEAAGFAFSSFFSRALVLVPLLLSLGIFYTLFNVYVNPELSGIAPETPHGVEQFFLFSFSRDTYSMAIHLLLSSLGLLVTARVLHRKINGPEISFRPAVYLPALVVQIFLLSIPFFFTQALLSVLATLFLGPVFVWMGSSLLGSGHLVERAAEALRYTAAQMRKALGSFLLFISLGGLVVLFANSSLTEMFTNFVADTIPGGAASVNLAWFRFYFPLIGGYALLQALLHLMLTASGYLYFSLKETAEAGGLLARIRQLPDPDERD
jgi:uncharacterized membrane protein SpoIIM required for sporulation